MLTVWGYVKIVCVREKHYVFSIKIFSQQSRLRHLVLFLFEGAKVLEVLQKL